MSLPARNPPTVSHLTGNNSPSHHCLAKQLAPGSLSDQLSHHDRCFSNNDVLSGLFHVLLSLPEECPFPWFLGLWSNTTSSETFSSRPHWSVSYLRTKTVLGLPQNRACQANNAQLSVERKDKWAYGSSGYNFRHNFEQTGKWEWFTLGMQTTILLENASKPPPPVLGRQSWDENLHQF